MATCMRYSSFIPRVILLVPAFDWALVAKLDTMEVVATLSTLYKALLILALPLATLAIGTGYIIGTRLIKSGTRFEAELASRIRAERAQRRFSQVVDSAPSAMLLIET